MEEHSLSRSQLRGDAEAAGVLAGTGAGGWEALDGVQKLLTQVSVPWQSFWRTQRTGAAGRAGASVEGKGATQAP